MSLSLKPGSGINTVCYLGQIIKDVWDLRFLIWKTKIIIPFSQGCCGAHLGQWMWKYLWTLVGVYVRVCTHVHWEVHVLFHCILISGQNHLLSYWIIYLFAEYLLIPQKIWKFYVIEWLWLAKFFSGNIGSGIQLPASAVYLGTVTWWPCTSVSSSVQRVKNGSYCIELLWGLSETVALSLVFGT